MERLMQRLLDQPTDAIEILSKAVATAARGDAVVRQFLLALFIRDEQIDDGSGSRCNVLVDLPYFGPTSLDVVLFAGTAIVVRISMLWRKSQSPPCPPKKKTKSIWEEEKQQDYSQRHQQNQVVKAKEWKPYKDPSLYKFIEETQQQKQNLRHVQDPAIHRQAKINEIRKSRRKSEANGPLGLSENLLQTKLQGLKPTGRTLVD